MAWTRISALSPQCRKRDIDALALTIEVYRAELVPDGAPDTELIARIGSRVNYWTRRCMPRKTIQLVWPEDRNSGLGHISVLSPLGAE